MPFKKYLGETKPINTPVCIHLRSKAMYTTGERDTDHPDEVGSHYCWCNLTQHVIGPDQVDVDRTTCNATRKCFRQTYEV